ncbi:MAG TPA: fumarate hydratase, partial [Burkholderiaceae bacterium]|nr:fumarate hydratase [Burkholderiaceae bacterium]
YHHPPDFVQAMRRAYDAETHSPAKAAIAQILINSRLAASGRRPLCQDTGVVQVFLKVGVGVQFARRDGSAPAGLQDVINQATRLAYTDPVNPLRGSMVRDPLGIRKNTLDNTPAIVSTELVDGDLLEVIVVAKGGGGDVKARFATLNPSDSIADWVLEQVPTMGAGWCPPGVLGVGVGGSPEQAMLLAKLSLFSPIDIDQLKSRGPADAEEALRLELHQRVNDLAIGAQGLGGLTTVLDVKVKTAPCHAATIPVALVPNCAATRYVRLVLDGSGPAFVEMAPQSLWDGIPDTFHVPDGVKVNLDELTPEQVSGWKVGQTLLLSGRVLTARDAAHKRLTDLIAKGEPLPINMKGRVVYYVGPVNAVDGEAVGPAGPTTATRMDKFVEDMLRGAGILAMIGKAERGREAIDAIRRSGAAYLAAVGGAAYLLSKSIRQSRVVAFHDLAMEAIHEFELKDFPVTVAVDSSGASIHQIDLKPLVDVVTFQENPRLSPSRRSTAAAA